MIVILCLSGGVAFAAVGRPCDVNSLGYHSVRGVVSAVAECQVAHPVVSDAKVCMEPCPGTGHVSVVWEGWQGVPLNLPPPICSLNPNTIVHVESGSESGGAVGVLVT